MSGLVGHTLYGLLALREAEARRLAIAPVLRRHLASYLAGAYLGCDIQVMPEAICVDTGREVGFGTVPLTKSPITRGAVRPWFLRFEGKEYRPTEIHRLFYGRAHLVFGWAGEDARLAVPWDHLPDYCASSVLDLPGAGRDGGPTLAYLFGWMVHVVGDSLIKSIRPGIKMHLLDGTYTPRNRPIQDLFAYHEIGLKEMQLDWKALFAEMAATPVEAMQPHYMRVADPGGRLGATFSEGWRPELAGLLGAVLKENRRWLPFHAADVLRDMALTGDRDHPRVSDTVRSAVGDLEYTELMAMAERSQMRETLKTITGECAALFAGVSAQVPALR